MNKLLYFLSLRGLGILNYEDEKISGERHFIGWLSKRLTNPLVIDVGANTGGYAGLVMSLMPAAEIYAFEPHPNAFQRLKVEALRHGYSAYNLGLGAAAGQSTLYDYKGLDNGSQHASIHRGVIEKLHDSPAQEWRVELTTLDQFVADKALGHIHLLKLDTEGYELAVLQGAQQCLERRQVDLVQFEFNEMNVVGRVFFADYLEVLAGFRFYRMLPDGLVPIGNYSPQLYEIFAFQNVVAVRPGCELPL